MAEKTFTVTGWGAVVVIIAVVGLFGYRVMTFQSLEDNRKLVEEVTMLLQHEYFPGDVANMKELYESGQTEKLGAAIESTTTTKINIYSISGGIPPFNFSSKRRKVVIKVEYDIADANGVRQEGTKYYRFDHSPIGNSWQWGREVTAISYYLNFI